MTLGLVLSGGGMRGVAHIGVIKALEEHGISPTHIAGSSSGAIIGALYAYGYDYRKIFKFFKNIQILDIKKYALNKPGFIDTEKFYPEFKSYLKEDDFKNLQKKLIITATDILSGNLELFSNGELIRPLLASAAFPGIFAPIKIKESYYIDGGALNNFPVKSLIPECDAIIGVYVNSLNELTIHDLKHSYNVIERAFKLQSVKEDMLKFSYCDLIIAPKMLSRYGIFDRKAMKTIFDIGYSTAKALINSYNVKMDAGKLIFEGNKKHFAN